MAGCAWRALKLYFDTYFDGGDVTPGAAGFRQTSEELLNRSHHPQLLRHGLARQFALRPASGPVRGLGAAVALML